MDALTYALTKKYTNNAVDLIKNEVMIRDILAKNKAKIREVIYPATQTKKVLLLYRAAPDAFQKIAYTVCKHTLLLAKIPFEELLFSTTIPANVAEYSVVIAPHVVGSEILTTDGGYFDGLVGVPVIVAGGGSGWESRTTRTHVSAALNLTDGTVHYKMPNGYDFYTQKGDSRVNAVISDMTNVENVVYGVDNANMSHAWIVKGTSNDTLFMPNYYGTINPVFLLYYVKLWGDYPGALPLPLCYDLDDANIAEAPYTADVQGLSDIYDYCKSAGILITAGIKTDYMDNASVACQYPIGVATAQTKFLQEHQDVFIPIVHDHHYNTWGATQSKTTLLAAFKERVGIARQYGFATTYDGYGYLFEPNNEYNDNAIALWKEIGVVTARDAGDNMAVYASDGTTKILIADRYDMSKDKLLWINACQYVLYNSASLAADLTAQSLTEAEWMGLALNRTALGLWGGFPSATHKNITDGYLPRASTMYFHGTNVSGDNPMLIGIQLVEGLRQAFPGTICYTHPSSLVNRSELSYLADR